MANTPAGESTADAVISLRDAVVSYREDVALRGVSLDVPKGELLGIMGPNGAGKTTILTLVNGLGRLLSGRVSVLGQDISNGCPSALRRRIGYVPQVHRIDPRMPVSAGEVVMMGRYGRLGLLRRPGEADRRAVVELLNLVDMTRLADRPIGHLSGGEQQRVAIARALAQEPEILLLDEPTTGLDRKSRTAIMELVQSVHRTAGLTTLMVTHAHRELALAVGLPANLIFYAMLVLTGSAITVSLSSIGGLLIFNLILNPAAAAYQLTYSLRRMFLLAAAFGILSTWLGLSGSYLFHFPSGAAIVLVSTSIFIAAAACSPKRRVKKL